MEESFYHQEKKKLRVKKEIISYQVHPRALRNVDWHVVKLKQFHLTQQRMCFHLCNGNKKVAYYTLRQYEPKARIPEDLGINKNKTYLMHRNNEIF